VIEKKLEDTIDVPHCGNASLVGCWVNAGRPESALFKIGKIEKNVKIERDIANLIDLGLLNFDLVCGGVTFASIRIV